MIKLNRNAIEDILNSSNETSVALITMQDLDIIHFSNSMVECITDIFNRKEYTRSDIAEKMVNIDDFQKKLEDLIYIYDEDDYQTVYWFLSEEVDNAFED